MEGSDSRATQGKIFAISADGGFAAAGVFAALATYNFIRDPLPESSIKSGKLLEFEDSMKARPVAVCAPTRGASERLSHAGPQRAPVFELTPQASGNGAGLLLGGHF